MIQKITTAAKSEISSLEPTGCYVIDLETGDSKPVKESEEEALLNTSKRMAFLRAPGNEREPRFYLRHNLPANEMVKAWQASQETMEGQLKSQGDWDAKAPGNPMYFERNRAGKVQFPGLTIEVGWQKKPNP